MDFWVGFAVASLIWFWLNMCFEVPGLRLYEPGVGFVFRWETPESAFRFGYKEGRKSVRGDERAAFNRGVMVEKERQLREQDHDI